MGTYVSKSEKDTYEFGRKIGLLLKKGDIVCLTGDLGAGKTTLTKAIAKSLNIDEYVTSPTFNIIHEYEGTIKLYHFDVYRLNDVEEMYDLGYEEYFFGEGVCIIEWANHIKEIIPDEAIWIDMKRTENNGRLIEYKNIKFE